MVGVSSTQIVQSFTLLACLVNICAAKLPLLLMWVASHELNRFSPCWIPSISFWIELGVGHCLFMAFVTVWALLSMIMSFRPRSQARRILSSTALASISRAPSDKSTFLHIAPINCLHSFMITTPTPQLPFSLNTAPSTLIL